MSQYIYFTPEQKEQAHSTDLVSFLRSRGETLKRSGSEYEWKTNEGKVTVRGNLWYHQYEREGGDAIDFAKRFYNLNYPQAVQLLLSDQGIPIVTKEETFKEKKPFKLPKANSDMRRVYAYLLKSRFIDREVINYFAHAKMLYEDAEFHNAVFVGYDENGTPRHAHKRGTFSESEFKGNVDSSDPKYSFHYIGKGNKLYVFEAPIDMISYISLHKENWQENSYAALCSVAPQAAIHILKNNPQINTVVACLDHDKAGIEGRYRIAEAVRQIGNYKIKSEIPKYKDWNESLRERNGLKPISASEHIGLIQIKGLCNTLVSDSSNEICPKYPLDELKKQFEGLKRCSQSQVNSITERSFDMSRVAFLFAKKQFASIERSYTDEQYEKMLFSLYQPHHDNSGYRSRITEIGYRLQELQSKYQQNKILPESEQLNVIQNTLALSMDCLRLSMYIEQNQNLQNENGSEIKCQELQLL